MHWLSIGLAIALGICVLLGARAAPPATSPDLSRCRGPGDGDRADARSAARRARARAVERRQPRRGGGAAQAGFLFGQIATTIDLDDAIGSTLQAAAGLPKVDAAVVELDPAGDGDERLLGSIGLDRDEDEDDEGVRIFTGAPETREARAIEHSYLYGEEQEAGAVPEALGVPLLGRNGRIGWLGVFSRDPEVRFGDDDIRRLEDLAGALRRRSRMRAASVRRRSWPTSTP